MTERPPHVHPQQDGVEVALVIGDDQDTASCGYVVATVYLQVENQRGQQACDASKGLSEEGLFGHGSKG